MLPRLTILGGSSPYTAALVDSILASKDELRPFQTVLHGRDTKNLELIRRYASARLEPRGWEVCSTTDRAEALQGADVVLHQVRYGGLSGRAADESLSAAFSLPADETLGPGALQAAIRMVPGIIDVARDIGRYCPGAWMLNLTNPLSLAVAVMSREGLKKCVGLCELPLVTLRQACAFLNLPAEDVEWSYSGLNHRGFIHKFSFNHTNLLPSLVEAMGDSTLGTITAQEIAELKAIPLKYFRLFRKNTSPDKGRAAFLSNLREEILNELRDNPYRSPASLSKRYLDWYPYAVVPMLAAISAGDGRVEVVNVPVNGSGVLELKARVFADHLEPIRTVPDEPVKSWVETFRLQEQTALMAALEPSPELIKAALSADPLIDESLVLPLTERLCQNLADRIHRTE